MGFELGFMLLFERFAGVILASSGFAQGNGTVAARQDCVDAAGFTD
jgi:hypothetical protein